MNTKTRLLAFELETMFKNKEKDKISAVLNLESYESSTTHYIYGYCGTREKTVSYKAVYIHDNHVYYGNFEISLSDECSYSFDRDTELLDKTKQEISWILELDEIKKRINTLALAIEKGGMLYGHFIDEL